MKEFIKHIETLLLEHECVIVPGFGGFVTHYAPARRVEKEHRFLPPYRTVGFNPSLTLNDGLLIQAYMQAHEVSYPVAQCMLEKAVHEIRTALSRQGKVNLGALGVLTAHINGSLEFHPAEQGLLAPALYGLGTFTLKPLSELPQVTKPVLPAPTEIPQPRNTLTIHINRTWLNHAVAVAAAVILFFILSTPVKNTYIEPESYASLGGSAGWLGQLHTPAPPPQTPSEVIATPEALPTPPETNVTKTVKAPKATVEAKAVPVVTPTPAPAPAQKKVVNPTTYHIIVSSVTRRADAEEIVVQLKKKGYTEATVIVGDGRARVALKTGTDKNKLNQEMIQLRQDETFKHAWLLTTHAR